MIRGGEGPLHVSKNEIYNNRACVERVLQEIFLMCTFPAKSLRTGFGEQDVTMQLQNFIGEYALECHFMFIFAFQRMCLKLALL